MKAKDKIDWDEARDIIAKRKGFLTWRIMLVEAGDRNIIISAIQETIDYLMEHNGKG